MLRIPKNIIQQSKYTSGGEFTIKGTGSSYKGHYSEVSGNFFSGKIPQKDSQILEKVKTIPSNLIKHFHFNPKTIKDKITKRFFAKKINESPSKIMEIDEETHNNLQTIPSYKTTSISWNLLETNQTTVSKTENIFPGIKDFLEA